MSVWTAVRLWLGATRDSVTRRREGGPDYGFLYSLRDEPGPIVGAMATASGVVRVAPPSRGADRWRSGRAWWIRV